MERAGGCVLYDASCGFCSRFVHLFEKTLARRGFSLAPLQDPPPNLGLENQEVVDDFRLVLRSGGHLVGAAAYRYLLRRIWWAYPLYVFSRTPLLARVFDGAYRTFASNRHRLSRACGLKPDAKTLR